MREARVLSDREISEELGDSIFIEPLSDIGPASIDLHVAGSFLAMEPSIVPVDPVRGPGPQWDLVTGDPVIHPGDFWLGSTIEHIRVSAGFSARVEGKSTLGRLGLMVHVTAGFIDPGFDGEITLELANVGRRPIRLTPGMAICQVSFDCLGLPAHRPYGHPELGSHYQGQRGVTPPHGRVDVL